MSSEPKKKTKDAKVDCGEDDGDISIHEGNQEKDIIEDFIPITNKAMDNDFQGMEDDISHGIKMRHHKALMAKAFLILVTNIRVMLNRKVLQLSPADLNLRLTISSMS